MGYQSSCKLTCDTGYKLKTGDGTPNCDASATWKPSKPLCEIVQCDATNFKLGKSNCSITAKISYNEICTFSDCNKGYNLTGSTAAACLATGKWNVTLPVCKSNVPSCPNFDKLTNGITNCSDTEVQRQVGKACEVRCTDNFGYVGSNTSVCQENGQWSNQLSCKAIQCKPDALYKYNCTKKGDATNGMYNLQSECHAECSDDSSKKSASAKVKCTDDKNFDQFGEWEWIGKEPVCKAAGGSSTTIIIVIGIVIAVLAGLAFIMYWSKRKPKSYPIIPPYPQQSSDRGGDGDDSSDVVPLFSDDFANETNMI